MEENTCKECVYFFCHYIREKGRYQALHCGHCIYPRLKRRESGAKACRYFRSVKHHRRGPEQLDR